MRLFCRMVRTRQQPATQQNRRRKLRQKISRRAPPQAKFSLLGGQRATRSERTWGPGTKRRAAALPVIAGLTRNPCHARATVVHEAWIPDLVRDDKPGQRATRSERTWGSAISRRAAPREISPLGGQRATRSERTWGLFTQDPRRLRAPARRWPPPAPGAATRG